MKYVIICEKCKRPGDVDTKKSRDGQKIYKTTCVCGGKIKPMRD